MPFEEEPTITSVLVSPYEARGTPTVVETEGQSSSEGNPVNTSNESQSIEGFRNEIPEENSLASPGAFSNKAYESEDGSHVKENSQSETPNSLSNLTFVSRQPFSKNAMDRKDDLMVVEGYAGLNGRSLKKRSDSYSPADYQTRNGRILLKNGQAKGVNLPSRSRFSISGIYDIQKRREQQRKKKRKKSSHVRFDLEDRLHPDELEWERQVYSNKSIPRSHLGFVEDDWSDAEQPLEFHTFGRSRNESKTDDSPASSISNGEDCDVLDLEDTHGISPVYPPSDDETKRTYVINPELETPKETPALVTQL